MVPPTGGGPRQPAAAGRLIVYFHQGVTPAQQAVVHAALGGTVVYVSQLVGWQLVQLPAGTSVEVGRAQYAARPEVAIADADFMTQPCLTPNDTFYASHQYAPQLCNCETAWDTWTGHPSVVVAICDTGVYGGHPEFTGRMWTNTGEIPSNGIDDDGNGYIDDVSGWNTVEGNNNPRCPSAEGFGGCHGTHCAGIACATGNNSQGIAGVAWQTTIMPVRCISAFSSPSSVVMAGVAYAVTNGADIISMSLGGGYSTAWNPTIAAANAADIVVVCAAGNDSKEFTTATSTWTSPVCNDDDVYPPVSNWIIGVACVDSSNHKSSASNYSDDYNLVDVSAPGVSIYSTFDPAMGFGSYNYMSNTSMACPFVAGECGLFRSAYPGWNVAQVVQAVRAAVENIDAQNPTYAGKLGTGRVDFSAAPVNQAPVANNDGYSTNEDTTLNVAAPGVLGNDTDADSDPLTAHLSSGPSHASSFTLNLNGSFTYTPDTNWNGTDSFQYRAYDGSLYSNVATVQITVNAVNDAPVADNDAYTTDEDTTLNVAAPGVLDGDTDADGDPLTAQLDTGPAHAQSFMLNPDGSFLYDPDLNWFGTDTFTYHANDGTADSNVAIVTITVNPVNDPPVANDDDYETDEDVVLNVAAPGVLGNDTDVENDPLTAVLDDGVDHGTLVLNADGSFTYTPNADFAGIDTFTYHANDGDLDSNIATVTITVYATHFFAGQWYRMSVPLQPLDPVPDNVLAPIGVRPADWRLWDLLGPFYQEYPGPGARNFDLGLGFWLAAIGQGLVKVAGNAADPNQPFQHPLPANWSILGCPFNAPVPWDDAHVQVEWNGQMYTLRRALALGLIADPIYGWERGHNVPVSLRWRGSAIRPWGGYLIWARYPCTLYLTHGPAALGVEPELAEARTPSRDDWQIGLVAEAGEFSDICTAVGVKKGEATTGLHPPLGPGIDLYVQAAEAFDDGTPGYALDLRGDATSEQKWDLVVRTRQTETEATLRWPDLSELPATLEAYLVDPAAGKRLRMRTAQSYSFATGAEGATRHLTIEVKPGAENALVVTSLSAQPTREGRAEIAFSLSAEATVDVTVLNIAGREVSRVISAELRGAGAQSVLWNGCDTAGTKAPSGRYLVRLTARTDSGATAKRVAPVVLPR
jgi:VCBS repeat-containing protein